MNSQLTDLDLLTSPPPERKIIEGLLEGDEQAFKLIYQIYSPRLFGKLVKLVKSDAEAQEILQEVFIKVWEHRKSIDPEKSFRSFLFKIAENKAYDFFRKVSRDKVRESHLVALSTTNYNFIDDLRPDDEHLAVLQKAIEGLPPQRQQVFRLCKLEGKSYKEVSEMLEISVSTISDHIVKGTKSIRDYFENSNPLLVCVIIVSLLL